MEGKSPTTYWNRTIRITEKGKVSRFNQRILCVEYKRTVLGVFVPDHLATYIVPPQAQVSTGKDLFEVVACQIFRPIFHQISAFYQYFTLVLRRKHNFFFQP